MAGTMKPASAGEMPRASPTTARTPPGRSRSGMRGRARGGVPRGDAPGEPDDGEDPTGPQQVRHAPEGRLGVHVVQGCDRGDQVERPRLEGRGEEIPDEIIDARGPRMGAGDLDASLIAVDAGDLRHQAA